MKRKQYAASWGWMLRVRWKDEMNEGIHTSEEVGGGGGGGVAGCDWR